MLALVPWLAHAQGRRGFHNKIYIVPTPGAVTIDGKLDDWDLSPQIMICVADETMEMQSARFAMMYDAEALYLSAVVKDPSPMLNRHDPKVEPDRAWDADVCQIYLCTDPALGFPVEKYGYVDGIVPEAGWFPVTFEVANDGPGFTGIVELSPGGFNQGQQRRLAIELPTGTTKRFVIPAFAASRPMPVESNSKTNVPIDVPPPRTLCLT